MFKNWILIKGLLNFLEINLFVDVYNMDVVVEWGVNGYLYIFKGNMFWVFKMYLV